MKILVTLFYLLCAKGLHWICVNSVYVCSITGWVVVDHSGINCQKLMSIPLDIGSSFEIITQQYDLNISKSFDLRQNFKIQCTMFQPGFEPAIQ